MKALLCEMWLFRVLKGRIWGWGGQGFEVNVAIAGSFSLGNPADGQISSGGRCVKPLAGTFLNVSFLTKETCIDFTT